MMQQPVRIIGAGIGGLTLGRCLLKHGVPSILYEKMPSAPRRGYGLTLHASSYHPLLEILGLDELSFRRRVAVDASLGGTGKIDPKLLVRPGRVDAASFRAHRGKLESLLREGLDIRWEKTVEKVEETSSGMALCLQSAEKLESACIIGADGPHSNARKSLSPDTALKVLPYVVFNGNRLVEQALFDSVYAPAMGGSNVIEMKQGDVVLNVSVNEQQAGAVTIGWTYSRPAKGLADPLHNPSRLVSGVTDISDDLLDEFEALEDLTQPFRDVFDTDKLETGRVLHWLMRTVLVSHQELQALAEKGVFFLGDSVHAEPILGGEGAGNAITDGIELAKCISTLGPDGITAWYDSMYPKWKRGVGESEKVISEMHRDQKAALSPKFDSSRSFPESKHTPVDRYAGFTRVVTGFSSTTFLSTQNLSYAWQAELEITFQDVVSPQPLGAENTNPAHSLIPRVVFQPFLIDVPSLLESSALHDILRPGLSRTLTPQYSPSCCRHYTSAPMNTTQRSQIIHAPSQEPIAGSKSVFLAGTTTAVGNVDWREKLSSLLYEHPITIFDPNRPDWDSTWREDITFDPYREQVLWELNKQAMADLVVFYFHPATVAPISLLEFGLSAQVPAKVVAVAPEGYAKRGNVQIVCHKFGIEFLDTIDRLHEVIINKLSLNR